MRAVLRRSNGPRHARIAVCDLEIDLASRVVRVNGEQIQLSAKEYELLVALAEDPERVFKKEELLRTGSRRLKCEGCGKRFRYSGKGRPRRFCGDACYTAAVNKRRRVVPAYIYQDGHYIPNPSPRRKSKVW